MHCEKYYWVFSWRQVQWKVLPGILLVSGTEYFSEDRVQWTVLLSILLESDTEEVLQSTVMEVLLNILSSFMLLVQYY